jgi:AraC-like DNA-binding protein
VAAALGPELPTLARRYARVSVEGAVRLMAAVATHDRRSDLPFAIARSVRTEDLGVLGFVMMTAQSGAALMDLTHQLYPLVSERGSFNVREVSDGICVSHRLGKAHDDVDRIWTESAVGSFALSVSQVVGKLMIKRVCFEHRAPTDTAPYRAHFGVPVDFGADETCVVYSDEFLAARPRLADVALHRFLREQALIELGALRHRDSFADRVRIELTAGLEVGDATVASVARRLHTSTRTLRRRLEEEGQNFRTMLEELRFATASKLLTDRDRSITEIALALGFSEASAFSRAFRRRHGFPPSQLGSYRA